MTRCQLSCLETRGQPQRGLGRGEHVLNSDLVSAGGMVLNPAYFGTVSHRNTMIHEMGHILGLYHVFKGVSERESCDDPCQVS